MTALVLAYALVLLALFVYGANGYVLAALRLRGRPSPAAMPLHWPAVTVQVPIYNERDMAPRVLDAVTRLDYPGSIEIQVLDDSTDDTSDLVARLAMEFRSRGIDIVHLRRSHRIGFKAGALAAGLCKARGEVIAVFDADFVPPSDFLIRTVPQLLSASDIGCVQTRWGHLNRNANHLTRAQAIAVDAHFAVEQAARVGTGWPAAFNGSAGIWRRRAIEDSGGWSADTLTEDLDLSYRAQLGGWRIAYLGDAVCPGELPEALAALKVQQRRWAQGSTQTARKILPVLWRSQLSLGAKLQGTIHLTHYAVHPLMLLSAALAVPFAIFAPPEAGFWFLMPPIALATGGPATMALCARHDLGERFTVLELLLSLVVGTGLALSNTLAVLRGFRSGGRFVRTPKGPSYASPPDRLGRVELTCAAGCAGTAILLLARGIVSLVPFLALYAAGLGWMGLESLLAARATRS
ncbi:MAG: glycosyltransferase [Myxococcota bacterium]